MKHRDGSDFSTAKTFVEAKAISKRRHPDWSDERLNAYTASIKDKIHPGWRTKELK